jgi:hypothetical protein
MGEWRYSFTILELGIIGGEWPASRPGRFTPAGRDPGTHWRGGRVDTRVGLDPVKKDKSEEN